MTTIDLTTATPEDLAALPPAELTGTLKGLSDKDLDTVMASPNRSAIIGAVFQVMPELFSTERGGAVTATTQWTITDRPDGGVDEWTVRIADGTCVVEQGHQGEPTLSLTMPPAAFVKVITKSGNPVMMFMTGKIKAKGDLTLAANFANLFDLPRG